MSKDLSELLRRLRSIKWSVLGVRYAILFGSVLEAGRKPRDIDIAVRFAGKPSLDDVVRVMEAVAEALGVDMDRVDVSIIDNDVDCVFLQEVFGKGKIVYVRDREDFASDVARLVKLCDDLLTTWRRLGLHEAQRRALERQVASRVRKH